MSDNERSRDHFRDREGRREPREGRDRGGTPTERRHRSRSPRERGGRRDNRYRSRSRSPYRKDEREGSGRGGDRGRSGAGYDRGRDRDDRRGGREDRSSFRNRSPQPPKGPRGSARGPFGGAVKPPTSPRSPADTNLRDETPDVEMEDEKQKPEGMDDEEWELLKVMGFGGFKSTKNTKVPGNDKNYGVRKDKQLQARQYMNRQGGFNRPLSPGRS